MLDLSAKRFSLWESKCYKTPCIVFDNASVQWSGAHMKGSPRWRAADSIGWSPACALFSSSLTTLPLLQTTRQDMPWEMDAANFLTR